MITRVASFGFILLLAGCVSRPGMTSKPTPWSSPALDRAPAVEWGVRTGLVQEVYYEGESYAGKPTRIFGYLGRPAGDGPFPAMVLVHGGGGKAFREWAEHWARRGYVALAMDTAGCGPAGRLPDGGPGQDDTVKFQEFDDGHLREMWSYHAVAAVLRGHSLVRSLPEVDPERTGITGISWGGYLTCIAAGVDPRFKVAVPVYGCGFLGENSCWKATSLARMSGEARARWLRYFDPSSYLDRVRCPILFLNGSNDFAYPLDSYQSSYRLVSPDLRTVCVVTNLPHGHIWTFGEVDAFVDQALAKGAPLPSVGRVTRNAGKVAARITSGAPVTAVLAYTTDSGEWQKRVWQTAPASLSGNQITAELPAERPLVYFIAFTDASGLRGSSEHEEVLR